MTTFDDIVKKVLANKNPPVVATIDTTVPPPVRLKKAKKPKPKSELVGEFTDQDYPIQELAPDTDPCQVCGKPSKVGAHGIREGKVYSEYYCFAHYNAKPGTTLTRESEEPDEQAPST